MQNSQSSLDQLLNSATQHHQAGRLAQAEALYREILRRSPTNPDALHLLGVIAHQAGRHDIGVDLIRRSLAVVPANFAAYGNLAVALHAQGKFDEAIAACRQAISLRADYPEGYTTLGNALADQDKLEEAIAAYRQAIALRPGFAGAFNNLANRLKEMGELDAAVAARRQAIALDLNSPIFHSNLLYDLHFHPDYNAVRIHNEHREFSKKFVEPLKKLILLHRNRRDPGRRLRIGYVSPDFRDHAESFFTVPLFENHDHANFEIFCYASVSRPDEITQRLAKSADVWRDVRNETDESLAQIIRNDQIDILIDLAMHMSGSRALLFARKPAPVQACWLAYPGTTGLDAMDYRITDSYMDSDADASFYVERSIRLPDCWVAYDPLIDLPPRSAEQSGPITFGSLNNPCKLNEPLVELWAKVLQAVPGSSLVLLVVATEQRRRILEVMERWGIGRKRLRFAAKAPRAHYLLSYRQIDIALDPLPYNGITTTCDALYMGTPVITLVGQTAAGRAGKGMLTAIGLGELVAHTPGEFVRIAAQLALDVPRLTEIRRGLRPRLMQSPLTDAPRFARNFEAACREMWLRWRHQTAPG